MTATASQCLADNLTALTNRVSTAIAGIADDTLGTVVMSFAISELEIDERATLGRADAKIDNHQHGHADAYRTRLKDLFEARFEHELIQPNQCGHQNHER